MNRDNLWAPWRAVYLRNLEHKAEQLGDAAAADAGSFLADYWDHPDQDEPNYVVYRDQAGMILLNRYPYASGHLLVALGDGRPRLLDYDPPQRQAFWQLVERAVDLVHQTLHPQGLNVGINEGQAAGAGVPGHLHAHVVPRWAGDTNFISVVGQVRIVPEALEETARAYRETLVTDAKE